MGENTINNKDYVNTAEHLVMADSGTCSGELASPGSLANQGGNTTFARTN